MSRAVYADRLEGFWLAQAIANWTGLRTELRRNAPPFYTDADWPVTFDGRQLFFVIQDPWLADDDTDLEYTYVSLMEREGTTLLSADRIRTGWIDHVNRAIFVSNQRARALMDLGLVPPETSVPSANDFWLRIDAQLTTEVFGALAPGLPVEALRIADLPIGVTARGHAAHAAQFFVVLHALAAVRPVGPVDSAELVALVESARAYLPVTSKAVDIIDVVLGDFLSNPDPTDWERTRDLVHSRYQAGAAANGFVYNGPTESSVNFGSALVCLLYGGGDLRETIRIGTLTGWDSDNPTATMGGLLGLMLGADAVRGAFGEFVLSDRYQISRTRDAMPDFLPGDPDAEDRFSDLAARMLTLVDDAVVRGGGMAGVDAWTVPAARPVVVERDNPISRLAARSANVSVRRGGGVVTAVVVLGGAGVFGDGRPEAEQFVNGIEHDDAGLDPASRRLRRYFWSREMPTDAQGGVTLEVRYGEPVVAGVVRLIEGDRFADGGWFESVVFEGLVGGVWVGLAGALNQQLDAGRPFQQLDFVLDSPTEVSGVRARGVAGGTAAFVTVSELDVLSPAVAEGGVDFDQNGVVNISDLFAFIGAFTMVPPEPRTDFDGNGVVNISDLFAYIGAFTAVP